MNNLFSKLNNRRGASILLALLLFLICALAGAAALTAASANIGRFSYLEQDQQQYLAVSSAAKLLRSQLDGLNATADFTATADKENEADIDFQRDAGGFCISDKMQYFNAEYTMPEVGFYRKTDETPPENIKIEDFDKDIAHFFKSNLESAVKSAFYNHVTDSEFARYDMWNHANLAEGDYSFTNFESFTLDIFCAQLDYKNGDEDVIVKADIEIESISGDLKEDDLDVDVTVYLGDTKYAFSGTLKVEIDDTNEKDDWITRDYNVFDPITSTTLSSKSSQNMVIESTIKVTISFEMDGVISRVNEAAEGGSTS